MYNSDYKTEKNTACEQESSRRIFVGFYVRSYHPEGGLKTRRSLQSPPGLLPAGSSHLGLAVSRLTPLASTKRETAHRLTEI